jgi:YegS/Rv2252/BmrU family lipid kinase
MGERLVVIANPRGGGGRAGARRAEIERAVDRAFGQAEVRWTEGPRHAEELAREAAERADIVAALGGDGTCHEVVEGLMTGPGERPRPIFSVVPFGTGGDLVRSLEIPKVLDKSLWIVATGATVPLDIGRVQRGGTTAHFVNVAGVGANGEVCVRANRSSKRLGGTVTFLSAIVATLASYRPSPARWTWSGPDGDGALEAETLAGFVANGHYCGAGLWVGRGGSMADGWFDLTVIPALGVGTAMLNLRHAADGRLDRIPGAVRARARIVEVHGELPVELDGEPQGLAPLRAEVLPRALHVRGGWLRPPSEIS